MPFLQWFSRLKNSNDDTIALKNSVSYTGECVLTNPPSDSTLAIYPRNEHIYPHKDINVHSNFFKIAPNWKRHKY